MKNFRERWDTFWFAPYSATRLALFRMLFCSIIFYDVLVDDMMASFWSGFEQRYFAHGFYSSYFDFLTPPTYPIYLFITRLFVFLVFTSFVGFLTPLSFLMAAGSFFYLFFLNRFFFLNHFYSLGIGIFLSALMPCAERLSWDAWLKRWGGKPQSQELVYSWSARLLQVMLSLIYLASSTSKLKPSWLSGEIVKALYENGGFIPPKALQWIGNIPFAWQAWMVLGIEFFLAFGLWAKKTRTLAVAVGILFHLLLNEAMQIGQFSWQMLAYYVLFLDPPGEDTRPEAGKRWKIFRFKH